MTCEISNSLLLARRFTSSIAGRDLRTWHTKTRFPEAVAAAAADCASASETPAGISTRTSLPAVSVSIVWAACCELGVARTTSFTEASSNTARRSSVDFSMPNSEAKACAFSREWPTAQTGGGKFRYPIAATCALAAEPVPTTATRRPSSLNEPSSAPTVVMFSSRKLSTDSGEDGTGGPRKQR